jgi:hypothetical protein
MPFISLRIMGYVDSINNRFYSQVFYDGEYIADIVRRPKTGFVNLSHVDMLIGELRAGQDVASSETSIMTQQQLKRTWTGSTARG